MSTDKYTLLDSSCAFTRATPFLERSPFVFENLIQKAKLFRSILSHVANEICTEQFISLSHYLLDLFWGDTSSYKFTVNGGEVDRDEAIGFQQIEELIQEPVRLVLNEPFEVR